MGDLMIPGAKRCETCRDGMREHYHRTDLTAEQASWWCWMFGCADCAKSGHICGETREV